MSTFTAREYLRYTRHIQLGQVGASGQTRLKNSHAVIVGCGGLGAPVSLYLAAAGVGSITLVDGDAVELGNLQRQITFIEADIGSNKARCTRQRLVALNSDISVHAVSEHLTASNADKLIRRADIVLDCTDDFAARCIINQSCRGAGVPWVYASVHQFSGQCAVFTPTDACFRCVFANQPTNSTNCNTAGVLGVLPGMLGTIQANEALKILLQLEGSLANKLLLVEALDMEFCTIQLARDPQCCCCGRERESGQSADDITGQIASSATAVSVAKTATSDLSLSSIELQALAASEESQFVDVRSPQEYAAFHLGGRNVPLALIESGQHGLDKNKPVVLYCQAGPRSERARILLSEQGYLASCLSGGLANALARVLEQESG